MSKIDSFNHEHRFLSNFWPAWVEYDGMSFPSVEHAYQAAKTTDRNERVLICHLGSASMAKAYGRKIKLRDGWDDMKLEIMFDLIRKKFENPRLKEKLLATRTMLLVEGNHWGDTFWGVCRGRGDNHLGKILMRVRRELSPQE